MARFTSPSAKATAGFVRRIEIKGFKSIVEQSIELGALNVFIGANGSGKTAVLEAIGVMGAAADGRIDDVELLRRGVRPGVPKLYKSAFSNLDPIPRAIRIRAESAREDYYSVSLDNPQDSPGTPWRFNAESIGVARHKYLTRSPRGGNLWDEHGRKKRLEDLDPLIGLTRGPVALHSTSASVGEFISALRGFAIFDPQTSMLRGTQTDPGQRDPVGLGGGRLAEALEALQRFGASPMGRLEPISREFEALVDWAAGVSAASPSPDLISPSIPVASKVVRFTDRFLRNDRNQLSAYDASEGALYVLFALVMMMHRRAPKFFAIENIGHALHPRLARSLVSRLGELANEQRRQIILTTHNPLVLDALALADDRIRLFAIDRTETGHTKINRIMHSEALGRAIESGLTMSQMWTEGLLGAVPAL
jgi:predicted ATPase